MKDAPIVIAGAGIAGLSAALAGWQRDVLIVEKAAAFENVGAGLQIGPNAVSALRTLGAWEAVEPITYSPPEIHIRDGVSGKCIKRIVLGDDFERRFGAPYRTAHRADLHASLLNVVAEKQSIKIKLNVGVESFEPATRGILVHQSDGAGSLDAAAVIAADGVHSTIRQTLFPSSEPRDSGLEFHRAMTGRISDIAGVASDCVNLWMLPGGHVVHYPVGRAAKINLVVIAPKGRSLDAAFPRACEQIKLTLAQVSGGEKWPGLFVDPLPKWNAGSVVLVGDAAHGTLPFLAQGAAMALEDAAALRLAHGRTQNLAQTFDVFSESRIARTARLHRATVSVGRVYHQQQTASWARNLVLRALPSDLFLQRLAWLYAPRAVT
jgi:salicylate hydroxylase